MISDLQNKTEVKMMPPTERVIDQISNLNTKSAKN